MGWLGNQLNDMRNGWYKFLGRIGKGASKFGYNVGKAGMNAVTGGAIERMEDRVEEAKQAELAVEEAETQADLMAQQRAVEKSAAERQTDIANRQMSLEAQQVSEQSRAAAIEKFQAESAGEANLGASGLAAGSSPYMALESSVGEASRKINTWFSQANEQLSIESAQAGGALEASRMGERASVANESLLRKNASLMEDQVDDVWDSFLGDTALDIGAGLLSTGLSAYSLGSSMAALKMSAGKMGINPDSGLKNIWDAVRKDSSSLFQLGGAVKYGQAYGDPSAVEGLFKTGGLFGDPFTRGASPAFDTSKINIWPDIAKMEVPKVPPMTPAFPNYSMGGAGDPFMGILKKKNNPWEITL